MSAGLFQYREHEATSGPDRIREAIARDRGAYAPSRPVVLCGDDPIGAKSVREWDSEAARRGPRTSLAERLIVLIHCPACLRFRCGSR